MLEPFRERWIPILICIVLLLGLAPRPSPQPLVTAINAAKISLQAGRLEAALQSIEEALFFEPAIESIRTLAAEVAMNEGQPIRAMGHIAMTQTQSEKSLEYQCLKSRALLMLEQLSEANAVWAKTGGKCPNREDFLNQLAQIYIIEDQPTKAEPILEQLFLSQDLDTQSLISYALVAATTHPERSMSNLRTVNDQIGDSFPVLPALIRTIEDARLSQDPAFTLAQVGQTLARNSEWPAAVWAFQNALNLNPEYVEVEAYLGLALDHSGGNGFNHLQNAAKAAETAPLPHIFLALHWQMQGDVNQAREELELAAQLDPENPVVAAELGTAYAAIGDIPAAISAYQLATELAPEEPSFWMLLAQFSITNEIETKNLGLPAARNALVLNPNLAPALDALAYGHFLEGNFYLAERLISRAIRFQPRRALTQYHLGLLFQAQGKIESATRAFEFAASLDEVGGVYELAERALNRMRP